MGTDGSQFAPFVDKEIKQWLFVSELCRSIWVEFVEEEDIEESVRARVKNWPPLNLHLKPIRPNYYRVGQK